MSEQQTDGEVRVILHLAPAWIHAETLLASPLHVVSPNLDSAVCTVLHTLPAETLCLLYPPKGDPKYARKKNGSLIFPPFLFPSLHPSFTPLFSLFLSLSQAKRLVFPEKETSFNGGTREKKEKKNHPAFLCFSSKRQLSLTLLPPFTPLHPKSRCRVQIHRRTPHGTTPHPTSPLDCPPFTHPLPTRVSE